MEPRLAQLLAHYRDADDRMQALPFYNPALSVELLVCDGLPAGTTVAVLITPWCLNLIWLAQADQAWPAKGERCLLRLPDGEYEGVVAVADGLVWGSAALLSDTLALSDQTAARALAEETMRLLKQAAAVTDDNAAAAERQPENPQRRALFRRALGGGA